ncbi:MAG: type II secretion system protein [Bacilli bacterium]|nr:type II secretion system protein [Bacilli bacterium]
MKKNGFTLTELIAVIVLIALLATVILINMTGLKSNEEESQAKLFEQSVAEAACTYIDMNERTELRQECKNGTFSKYSRSDCSISLATLIDDSVALIEPDKKDLNTNKTAEEEKDDVYVEIVWKSDGAYKVKECNFKRR